MKVRYNVNDKLTFELNSNSQRELFEELATLQEIFGNAVCGKCGKSMLKFVVRDVDDNKYYEMHCMDCRAKLAFGCHKNGITLFPKRKDGEKYLPDGGWMKWDKDKKESY